MVVHYFQRGPTAVALRCEKRSLFWRVGFVLNPKSRSRDVGLVAVLLEEHPLKDECELLSIFRKKFRAAGQVGENGVGFGKYESVVVVNRRAAVGIDLQEFSGTAFAFQDVHVDDLVWDTELRKQQANFIGIARV